MDDPLRRFATWYREHCRRSADEVPGACCLSSVGTDGYPNARFVALKAVEEDGLVITGPGTSRKGREIARSSRVALTFWWPSSGRQTRIQGDAHEISPGLADEHFGRRSRASQLAAWACAQGEPIGTARELETLYADAAARFQDRSVPRPDGWTGYRIVPVRIEFLSFRSTRLHERVLYTRVDDGWESGRLQP